MSQRRIQWIVTGPFAVFGHQPGERFYAALSPVVKRREAGGQITRAPRPEAKPGEKPKRPKGARKPRPTGGP